MNNRAGTALNETQMRRVFDLLDPQGAVDDSLILDIHRRLNAHGEKYPDRMVSILHRNVMLYTVSYAMRAFVGLPETGGT